jgi:hypothetical protein
MKPRAWKKKAFKWMKKIMIPEMKTAFKSLKEENEYAHRFARNWVKDR